MTYPLYSLVKFLKGEVFLLCCINGKDVKDHLKEQYMKANAYAGGNIRKTQL